MSMPLPFVCPVAGISQYQEEALTARPGDPVKVLHEPDNPYDANACKVLTGTGLLGYVPAAVAARLVATGSAWEGEVDQVLSGGACVGVRIRVLAVAQNGAQAPEAREDSASAPAEDPPTVSPPSGGGITSPPVLVRARSGRVLGSWAGSRPGFVLVQVDGRQVEYPESLVLIETSASA